MSKLSNKLAIITGAGQGIGRVIAKEGAAITIARRRTPMHASPLLR
ncbi:MAG: hypothetical protein HOC20_13600 [Chloroflexi bacterium]|nr:hypothetical protein [Chloroflexota bacterium]